MSHSAAIWAPVVNKHQELTFIWSRRAGKTRSPSHQNILCCWGWKGSLFVPGYAALWAPSEALTVPEQGKQWPEWWRTIFPCTQVCRKAFHSQLSVSGQWPEWIGLAGLWANKGICESGNDMLLHHHILGHDQQHIIQSSESGPKPVYHQ